MLKTVLGAVLLFLMIGFTAYLAFHYAPIEKTMGPIQKIFYLHLPSAFSSFLALGVCFYANLRYVFSRQAKWDWLGVSAAEVGLVFISVVLVTGPIWAHPVWGIWWNLGCAFDAYVRSLAAVYGVLAVAFDARRA